MIRQHGGAGKSESLLHMTFWVLRAASNNYSWFLHIAGSRQQLMQSQACDDKYLGFICELGLFRIYFRRFWITIKEIKSKDLQDAGTQSIAVWVSGWPVQPAGHPLWCLGHISAEPAHVTQQFILSVNSIAQLTVSANSTAQLCQPTALHNSLCQHHCTTHCVS